MQNGHNHLHVGLIQVVVNPLTRTELDTSNLERYMTHKLCQFHVGLVESFLSEWPIYFNCFLNFSVTVSDPGVLKTLILSFDTQGYDMESWSQNLVMIYRISYKVINTIVPKAKIMDSKGQTTLFQAKIGKAHIVVPKMIRWNEITLPER